MTPSLLAREIADGLAAFLRTTFPVTSPFFEKTLETFLTQPGGLMTGPWVQLRLPFRQATNFSDPFNGLLPNGFVPYFHQQQAFQRLHPRAPESTVIATGTGSGKTESFLYPILEHCRRQAGRPGIKAILIYPMNALATDQAQRVARLIHGHPDLNNRITAGLYLGEGEEASERPKHHRMDETQIIDDRTVLRASPPDILLTNYKMLDLLLLRPEDYPLWARNTQETLRYLVVDELHTFDGAQGADLACLIRRLKSRLATPPGHLCCVGTSATLGDASTAAKDLVEFARYLFGETLTPDAVIGETLQTIEEFLAGEIFEFFAFPSPEALRQLSNTPIEYLNEAYRLWFPAGRPLTLDPKEFNEASVQLALQLRRHSFLRNFLVLLDGQARSFTKLVEVFRARFSQMLPGASPEQYLESLLGSFIALVSHARTRLPEGQLAPFLPVRLQLWMRELSRVVASVTVPPVLRFSDDLSAEDLAQSLPLLHCRECGLTGWGAVARDGDTRLDSVLKSFYAHFFALSPRTVFLFDYQDNPNPGPQDKRQLCPKCLNLQFHPKGHNCDRCGHPKDQMLDLWLPDMTVEKHRASGATDRTIPHHCPRCGGHNSLTILGSRAASLLSVAFSQLYQSPNNQDKKLLAFSDNVQDASHRAGFFSGRTWSTNFRTALHQLVQTVAANQAVVPLATLANRFADHYLKAGQTPEEFSALFIAPDMDFVDDFQHLHEKGVLPTGSNLPELVMKRIDWQIWGEYTFNSRIGRTLEKSASSMVAPNADRFEAALKDVALHLPELIGEFRDVPLEDLRRTLGPLVLTILNELRRRGGVLHPHLKAYLENDGEAFLLGKRKPGRAFEPWRPPTPYNRRPAFLTPLMKHDVFLPLFSGNSKRPTWFEAQFTKALGQYHGLAASLAPSFYTQVLLPALERAGLLVQHSTSTSSSGLASQNFVWGIPLEAFDLTLSIANLRCGKCRYSVQVPRTFEAMTVDAPCPNSTSCSGRLVADVQPDLNFYRELYQNGELARVYAAEHTGLLTREKRERLEDAFRSSVAPAAPNLLSCTPTLEMGINIGDLSAVALCSVPPKPANYVQRVGRAGRANGNALVLLVAANKPHDLFFFLEPEEMIRGQVDPPGLFLEAAAVLERQFTAFVFDSWTVSSKGMNKLPLAVVDAILGLKDAATNIARFPNNFLHYFESNRSALEDAFLEMFSPFWAQEKQVALTASLRAFSRGEQDDRPDTLGLAKGIVDALRRQEAERSEIKKRLTTLRGLRKKHPHEGTISPEQLEQEKQTIEEEERALQDLHGLLEDANLLSFLTNAGLLPNYAFPETGVTLRSVILRSDTKQGPVGQRLKATYVRPASAGLLELAPSNTFYAEGRKLEIDSVSFDPKDYKPWRICRACNYMAAERDVQTVAACPCCGDTLFADAGQIKHLLRLRTVTSTMRDFESRSYDESDQRNVVFFQTHTFTNFEKKDVTRAWRYPTDAVPFGFEFLNRVTLRDVNFGRAEPGNATKLKFAGQEIDDRPFLICSDCGKVQKAGVFVHASFCRHWNAPQKQNAKDPGIKASFLYREISSEAIRILLPIGLVDAQRNFESFVAALAFGLRRYFKGETAHLQTCKMDEPSPDPRIRKQYLVLYDSVPGGTGYLKDLMRDATHLMKVFELALTGLKACSCNLDATKDGCYRCLLYYRTRHNAGNTSRRAAIELLEPIVAKAGELKEVTNLDHLQINRFLESQLEARFIEGLRRFTARAGAKESKLDTAPINGKMGYMLKLGTDLWQIEPQVVLGSTEGVAFEQRADFLLTPLRPKAGELPIAVYTDGYEFHAAGANRLKEDTLQRLALRRSGRYRFWSLTWDDVDSAFLTDSEQEAYQSCLLKADLGLQNKLLARESFASRDLNQRNSFSLLCDLLTRGREWRWDRYALSLALGLPKRLRLPGAGIAARWEAGFPTAAGFAMTDGEASLTYVESGIFSMDAMLSNAFASGMKSGLAEADLSLPIVLARFDDKTPDAAVADHKRYWRDFLRLMNLFQFLPGAVVLSSKAWDDPILGDWLAKGSQPKAGIWGELAQELDAGFLEFLKFAASHELPSPQACWELVENEETVAFSQLAWPEHEIAMLLVGQADFERFEARFVAAGYRVFTPESALADEGSFLPLFKGSGPAR